MAFPQVTAQIAFDSDPDDEPQSYTDVSARLRHGVTKRGRNDETRVFECGTGYGVFENLDRELEPENPDSTYYPNVIPLRRVRYKATYNSVIYYLHTGYMETPTPVWVDPDEAYVEIVSNDGLEPLKVAVTDTYSSEGTGARITNVLDSAEWPSANRVLDTGAATIQASNLVNVSALEHMTDVCRAEYGYVFVNGQGYVVFHDRNHRTLYSDEPKATLGDLSGHMPFEYLTPRLDIAWIFNDIRLTRIGGTEQVATDATSIAHYRRRVLPLENLLLTSDEAVLAFAQYLLGMYKNPVMRFEVVQLNPAALVNSEIDPWPLVLGLEIGDRLTVAKSPPGGGDPIAKDVYVESIEHRFGPATEWTTILGLSPADEAIWFKLNSATAGLLDTGMLAF